MHEINDFTDADLYYIYHYGLERWLSWQDPDDDVTE